MGAPNRSRPAKDLSDIPFWAGQLHPMSVSSHIALIQICEMACLSQLHAYFTGTNFWPLLMDPFGLCAPCCSCACVCVCVSHFLSIPRNSVVLFIAHLLEIIVLNRAFTHKYILESAYVFYMMDQNFGCSHDYILWGHLCLLLEKLALGCSQVLVQDQPSYTNRPSVTFSIMMFN